MTTTRTSRTVPPSAPASGWVSRTTLALLTLALLSPSPTAQLSGADHNIQPSGPASSPSVFNPPGGGVSLPPTGGSGGDGGTGGPPGTSDGPQPPGLPTDGRRVGNGRSGPVRQPGQRPALMSRGGDPNRSSGQTPLVSDTWDMWWETNKFDFIDLRRVEDVITANQGDKPETPAQREIRLAAVRATIRERILPVLRDLTSSDDPSVRAASIVALAKLRDETCTDLATRMLGDGSLQVRRSAILALGVLTSGRASWVLMNIADDNRAGQSMLKTSPVSVDDRGTALVSATLRGDTAMSQLLGPLLDDHAASHPELLAMAADAAGLMGSTDAIRPLIEIAFDADQPEYVRSAAASALGRIGDPSVTPALMKLLDTGIEPRRAAAAALGLVAHPGATKVIERLGEMLEHEVDSVSRHFAAVSLGRIGGHDAQAALQAAFLSARVPSDMRPWLALGLGLCARAAPDDHTATLLIAQAEREANSLSVSAYAVALGLCRSELALPKLMELSRHSRSDIAGYAAIGLGLSGQAGASTRLRAMLSGDSDPLVLRLTAMGLGILGDRKAVPDLLDLIRTTNNPSVASFAAIGIGFLGDSNAVGPLLDLIKRRGPDGVATTYAVTAIGQLFDRDRRPALSRLAAGDNYVARATAVGALLELGF